MHSYKMIQVVAIGSAKCELISLKARLAEATRRYSSNVSLQNECRLLEAQIMALEEFIDTATV